MASRSKKYSLRDLLLTTKDGDWGRDEPTAGFVPYRVIRGGDFESARFGDLSGIPCRYLDEKTVSRRTLQDRDILIETAGGTRDKPTGRSLLIKKRTLEQLDLPATCASFARFLRIDPQKAVPDYIFWVLQHMYKSGDMWQHQVQHTGVARFQFTTFAESVEFLLPPEERQRAVACILGALDDKIALNHQINDALDSIGRIIFKAWFVDFNPVRAKANGEEPDSICQRLGLPPDLLTLFPDRFQDSELGEIPEGWRRGTLSEYCALNSISWTAQTIPEKINYVDLTGVKNGIIKQVHVLTSAGAPSRARRVLRTGDTIIGTVRPGNRSFALIGDHSPQLTGSTGFAVLSPKRPQFREMVYFLATSDENIARLSHFADGAVYPAVRPDMITAGACVVPKLEIVNAFHQITAPLADYHLAIQASTGILSELRDFLLPRLLSGELPV